MDNNNIDSQISDKSNNSSSFFSINDDLDFIIKDKESPKKEPAKEKETISNDIKYVGVNDHSIDLFEGQYDVPNGMMTTCQNDILARIAVNESGFIPRCWYRL